MKKLIIFLFLIVLTTSCKTNEIVFNSRNIFGVVFDEHGQPLPGIEAQVIRENKTISSNITDFEGNFIVEGKTGDILVVNIDTYPDKGIKAIMISDQNNYNIKLGAFNSFSNKRIKRIVKRVMKRRMMHRIE